MKEIKKITMEDELEIKQCLLGRSVKVIDDDKLQLDNGLILHIIPNQGCAGCASGNYHIEELNECPNVITNVETVCDYLTSGEDERSYKIFVLAENKRIKLLQVDGDTGNGYYGSGYEIIVKAPLKGFS
jgi:hypothetical protein